MRTPIIYYGGKTSMLPVIMPLIPKHTCYTEVYFGGGSIFWAKDAVKNETINDILDMVINFYQQLKSNYTALKGLITETIFSRTQHDKALSIIRSSEEVPAVLRAWAFWFTSNFSYGNKIGGGIKHSSDSSCNPPDLLTKMKNEFTEKLVERIEHVHIENRPALQVLNSRDVVQAFHFLDPPYPEADQGHYKGFTWQEYERLLVRAETIKGLFMLCNFNSPMLESYVLKNGWWRMQKTYNNKGMRKDDKSRTEIIVCNYIPQQQPTLFDLIKDTAA
jgi:DNA adenine methylase